MVILQGKGVSKGIAHGRISFFRRSDQLITFRQEEDPEAEIRRFQTAQRMAAKQLRELAAGCGTGEQEITQLFETHAMLAEDETLSYDVLSCIREKQCNAEYAVKISGEQYALALETLEDPYLQARAADVRDVMRQILKVLVNCPAANACLGDAEDGTQSWGKEKRDPCEAKYAAGSGRETEEEPMILAADEFTPSETLQLDRRSILAFVTAEGSENSHTAILARIMGVPAICGIGSVLNLACHDRVCCLDGETGEVCLDPDEETCARFREKEERQQEQKRRLDAMRGQEDIAPDGRRLTIGCNIGFPEDVKAVLENDGREIGLFRSEFLFLRSAGLPAEEEQFQAYRSVLSAMDGKRVVIRTLDIGADKQVDYLKLKKEENPALGVRAIRICLNRPELFRTQLRAIYRASAYGKAAILFPMITSVWEVQECRRFCREVMAELDAEGTAYDPKVEIGVMVETPASVFQAEELAKEADFFSIGTNDLTQYLLACDRQANDMDRFFDSRHPAVLRAIRMTAEAAKAAGIPVEICGELGADAGLLSFFLEIGIDGLSVPPAMVLPMREKLRRGAKNSNI